MTLVSLLWTWGLIAVVCIAGGAIARLVGHRLDDAEAERSRRQWKLMCEVLDCEDLAGRETLESEPRSESALAAFGVHRARE